MKQKFISYKLVEFIPETLADGKLYVSEKYKTAVHKCCCGCGEEAVTPLHPTDWSIKISNSLVSLYPSVGNWSFKCQSHYWILNGQVVWAEQFSKEKVNRIRQMDQQHKKDFFNKSNAMRRRRNNGGMFTAIARWAREWLLKLEEKWRG